MAPPDLRERLAARQHTLQQRSAELRERLAGHAVALAPAFTWADRARDGWRWVRAHPWVPLALTGVLVLRRPRLLWRGLRLSWRGWRLWLLYGGMVRGWRAGAGGRWPPR
ncbi:YqjK-like protein [Tepidimonas thermarum]|uniref:YqjK-like protein n=1 Tax=Tepidimonas thermarum TaxID=335431 RepID=A0A554X6J5_9BURK|nr:YqjK-like family protein [Tepidimonas thermarum]TSE31455.1 YqjK-like protein [Tepidimonas thermarum]